MKFKKVIGLSAIFSLLIACAGGLPPSVQRNIAYEHERLQDAERQVQQSKATVEHDVAADPDLFGHSAVPGEWHAKFDAVERELADAKRADRELQVFKQHNVHANDLDRVEKLIGQERTLREVAAADSQAMSESATKWVNFKHDLPTHLDELKRDYEAVQGADFKALGDRVSQAEQDWPGKKDVLERALETLRGIPVSAGKLWIETEAARTDAAEGKASGTEIATLIEAEDIFSKDVRAETAQSSDLIARSGQLYDSWDKILTDLDKVQDGRDRQYREQIKTVRTHLVDVAAKKTETSSSEQWVDVPESSFHNVENDVGMAIAHKDAGVFDDEAQNTPQPAGFAYIAPETQPGNQYGYWDHSGGHSVWTWLPEYLILRELLWNHDYRPVVVDEYRGYRAAQRAGQTYYGRETPASPPKYGTHGTFTQTHYAGSRYVQSGGFKGSAYSSHGAEGSFSQNRSGSMEQHSTPAWNDKSAGRRFGSGAGAPSGRRFGQSNGFRGMGRSFGRRR